MHFVEINFVKYILEIDVWKLFVIAFRKCPETPIDSVVQSGTLKVSPTERTHQPTDQGIPVTSIKEYQIVLAGGQICSFAASELFLCSLV